MKNLTVIGIAVGLVFALCTAIAGLSGFLWALLFSVIGGLVGAHYEGRIDLAAIFSGRGGRG